MTTEAKGKSTGGLRCVLVLCPIEKRIVSMTNSLEPCWVFIFICIPQNFKTIKEVSLLHRVTPVLIDDWSCLSIYVLLSHDYLSCFLELFQDRNKKEETFVKCSQPLCVFHYLTEELPAPLLSNCFVYSSQLMCAVCVPVTVPSQQFPVPGEVAA